ncbi:MAG: hypothetical protein M1834_002272 [Cirrosporium novae-zelandiae]|nr:MAG: hypothetical protein M1834_002272 [Cirrosporium novae-zelandiae]
MTAPTIPPRPSRVNHPTLPSTAIGGPEIPPRPRFKRLESPHRDSYARSPLNAPHFHGIHEQSDSPEGESHHDVRLPSIGQEGTEYADLEFEKNKAKGGQPQEGRIASDLKLHAPKPSLPSSSAQARIATVTRTDAEAATKSGIPAGDESKDPQLQPLSAKRTSFSRPTSSSSSASRQGILNARPLSAASSEQRTSMSEDEHGIPEIGLQVPMYPNAGDVQAPSPTPFSTGLPSAMASESDLNRKPGRHHGRTRSGREHFGPPGSYGLHAHGQSAQDKFEKAWYEKHPEEDHGLYAPGLRSNRSEWALSSEDLNKIVRDTVSRGAGFGTSPLVESYPDEQYSYRATEEYTSRIGSPASRATTPQNLPAHHKDRSSGSQPHVESPLRKTSFPAGVKDADVSKLELASKGAQSSDHAIESETEDDVIRVTQPAHTWSKVSGRVAEAYKENRLEGDEGYETPILAPDEVAKSVGIEQLHPAISPPRSRRGSNHHTPADSDKGSRPSSIHGAPPTLARLTSQEEQENHATSLADVEEYEPLFPEDETESGKALTPAERFKRRPEMKRRFPSQDIWEDAPSSVNHYAEVSTPEPQETTPAVTKDGANDTTIVSEPPDKEAARKGEVPEEGKAKFIPKEQRPSKSILHPSVRDDMPTRPGIQHRFPSKDIWEDTADSQLLVTTVASPQIDETTSPLDEPPITARPAIPPRPARNHSPINETGTESAAAQPPIPAKPKKMHQVPPLEVPPRPAKSPSPEKLKPSPAEGRKPPVIPERPKPQIPRRPAKLRSQDSPEDIPVSKVSSKESASSETEPTKDTSSQLPAPKPKPSLPIRPNVSKIAALKAGFLSTLEERLALGPQGPPKPAEKEEPKKEESIPLSDARKGRARGPARRKPAAVPSNPITESAPSRPEAQQIIAAPGSIWQIGPEGGIITAVFAKQLTLASVVGAEEIPLKENKEVEESQTKEAASEIISNTIEEPAKVPDETEVKALAAISSVPKEGTEILGEDTTKCPDLGSVPSENPEAIDEDLNTVDPKLSETLTAPLKSSSTKEELEAEDVPEEKEESKEPEESAETAPKGASSQTSVHHISTAVSSEDVPAANPVTIPDGKAQQLDGDVVDEEDKTKLQE